MTAKIAGLREIADRFDHVLLDQWGTGVASDAAGNVLVTGFFEGTVDFGGGPLMSAGSSDVFVVKLEP